MLHFEKKGKTYITNTLFSLENYKGKSFVPVKVFDATLKSTIVVVT